MRAHPGSPKCHDRNCDCNVVLPTRMPSMLRGYSLGANLAVSNSALTLFRARWRTFTALFVVVTSVALATTLQAASDHVAANLRTWASVMEMFRTDDGMYPETTSIAVLAASAKARGYWAEPVSVDDKGRAYTVRSASGSYRIASRSGELIDGAIEPASAEHPDVRIAPPAVSSAPHAMGAPRVDAPDSPGTSLSVNKSGNDIVLSWTGTGTVFAGAEATDGPFANTGTLFTGLGGLSYTYTGAVVNPRNLEFFDISDETETNRGGNWNGGVLAPALPAIDAANPSTNIGSLFIGSAGTIVGTGFSTIPGNNTICFSGGVCTQATTATATQVQFVTPPGALSGNVTVAVGERTSSAKAGSVTLSDPASGWLIRTIGFSRQDKSYWMAGTASGVASLYRVYFDGGTGKWAREDRGGAISGTTLFCSTKTSRTGRFFCGQGTISAGNHQTYVAETSPPANLANCLTFFTAESNSVRGAAVDPNPGAVVGRDVVYFAQAIDSLPPSYLIRKVAADCSGNIDTDYGNHNWSGSWNGIVGMAVDPVNGDLYLAAKTEIYKIAPDESLTLVKGGFTSVNTIDIYRQGANDPGLLLVADGGSLNVLKAFALDNPAAEPLAIASLSVLRGAAFGLSVSGGPWLGANVNRAVVIANNGNTGAVDPLRPFPIDVTPTGPLSIRISSPSTSEQAPRGQSRVRPATAGDTSFSQAFAELRYRDGLARFTCAWTGDPGAGAPQYDPTPGTLTDCQKPRAYATAICDNKDDIVAGAAGSFVEAGNPIQSCKTCGSASAPCHWDFRITNHFGGDNYKVFFGSDAAATEFVTSSDVYTATKHVHLERDRMCRAGGVLFKDYGATGQCGGAGQPPCCGTAGQPACNQIVVYDPVSVLQNDVIVVFDEANSYEAAGYTRTVTAPPVNNGNGTITLTLDAALPRNYRASSAEPGSNPPVPDYRNAHAGGVCVPAAKFYEPDTSDLQQGFDEAFVDYHTPIYGVDGSGVVPTLPSPLIDLNARPCALFRFSRIWFSRFVLGASFAGCPDPPADQAVANNVMQLIGASRNPQGITGVSNFEENFSYIFRDQVTTDCGATTPPCTPAKQDTMHRWTVGHELAHNFQVDACSVGGHDTRSAWCGSASGACVNPTYSVESCSMDPLLTTQDLDMRADGIDHFCAEDLILGDPSCAGTPRPGAMRTWEDPQ